MIEKIISILCKVKKDNALLEKLEGSSDIINDVGLDSLQMINFVLMIEDEFGVEIDFEEFDIANLKSIEGFCSFIEKAM